MGVFAKLDGLKKPIPTDFSFGVERCAKIINGASGQASLQDLGMTSGGIKELASGKPMSNPKDRLVVARLVSAALG